MEKITYNLVYNRKKKLNKKGTALVQVEAYLQRKKKYFSTKVYLKPEQWDNRKRLIRDHPNKDSLNQMIHQFISDIESVELDLWRQGKIVTLSMLKEISKHSNSLSFLVFYEKEVENANLKESTKLNHLSTLRLLKQHRKEVTFSDLDFEFISSFEQYLLSKKYHLNTIAKHMKHLKRHVNSAINKEYIELHRYAFRKYKIKTYEGRHIYLTPDELIKLEQLKLNKKNVKWQKTLDAFLFCCYTGLRYSDFSTLNSKNIEKINEDTWLIYKSVKTNIEIRIPLYLLFGGKGIDVLEKYKNNLNDFFLLKDNSCINKELIKLRKLAGIEKHFSFHTARHRISSFGL